MRHAMIMAGGAGTRLWPMSRRDQPKQLVPLIDHEGRRLSLLQVASMRLEGMIPAERRLICTNEGYRAPIMRQMPELSGDSILGEPVGRDTVNAVGFAAAVLQQRDPEAVFAVLTADHLIRPIEEFQRVLDIGYRLVEKDPTRLVTFSIKPTYAATGFGYVERGRAIEGFETEAFRVERFVEKPSLERAQAYLESGSFAWNSGMFVWRASTFMDCLRRYKPESYQGLLKIGEAWDTDRRDAVLNEVYPQLPKISVDYAVMEPAAREQQRTVGKPSEAGSVKVVTVQMDCEWLDVGSWPSYGETLKPDASGNRTVGNSMVLDSEECLVVNADDRHRVAVLGAEGLIVVHTPDATLVMPADKAQDLKNLHSVLPEELR